MNALQWFVRGWFCGTLVTTIIALCIQHRRLTQYFAMTTEGGRIGLAICTECGCTILLGDEQFDAAKRHEEWHIESAKRRKRAD